MIPVSRALSFTGQHNGLDREVFFFHMIESLVIRLSGHSPVPRFVFLRSISYANHSIAPTGFPAVVLRWTLPAHCIDRCDLTLLPRLYKTSGRGQGARVALDYLTPYALFVRERARQLANARYPTICSRLYSNTTTTGRKTWASLSIPSYHSL